VILIVDFLHQAFKCHRLILASASPVFECLLFGKFEEACKSKDEIIAIDDVSENNLDAVIRYYFFNNKVLN